MKNIITGLYPFIFNKLQNTSLATSSRWNLIPPLNPHFIHFHPFDLIYSSPFLLYMVPDKQVATCKVLRFLSGVKIFKAWIDWTGTLGLIKLLLWVSIHPKKTQSTFPTELGMPDLACSGIRRLHKSGDAPANSAFCEL